MPVPHYPYSALQIKVGGQDTNCHKNYRAIGLCDASRSSLQAIYLRPILAARLLLTFALFYLIGRCRPYRCD